MYTCEECDFSGTKSDYSRHTKTNKHINNMEKIKNAKRAGYMKEYRKKEKEKEKEEGEKKTLSMTWIKIQTRIPKKIIYKMAKKHTPIQRLN